MVKRSSKASTSAPATWVTAAVSACFDTPRPPPTRPESALRSTAACASHISSLGLDHSDLTGLAAFISSLGGAKPSLGNVLGARSALTLKMGHDGGPASWFAPLAGQVSS